MALIACSNLALTQPRPESEPLAKKVDDRLIAATSRFAYAAEIASLNFADPAARDAINSWVKTNTEDKIEKIVDNIRSDEVLFLINAIYFKGQWQFEFDKKMTKPDVFRLAGGKQKELPMMWQSGSYFY